MSTSQIACPTCATPLLLPTERAAGRFRCTQCGTVFETLAPAEPVPEAVAVLEALPLPVPEAEEEEPEPRRPSRRRRDEDADDEPRRPVYTRKAQREPIPKLQIALVALVGVLLLAGLVVGAYYAVRETPKETVKNEPPKIPPKPLPKVEALTPEQLIRKVKTSTVYIRTQFRGGELASGSGFCAGKSGYVVTNAHVIGYGPAQVRVPTRVEVVVASGETDERTFPAKVFGLDAELDLAVLQIEGRDLPAPLTFGKAEQLIETQEVVVFGYPFGERLGKNVSVNRTTVSSLRKTGTLVDVVQLAGGLNPGNSGGPVTNAKGEVIGVSVARLRGTDTIAFAIPAEMTDRFVDDQLACGGQIRLGFLANTKPEPNEP